MGPNKEPCGAPVSSSNRISAMQGPTHQTRNAEAASRVVGYRMVDLSKAELKSMAFCIWPP